MGLTGVGENTRSRRNRRAVRRAGPGIQSRMTPSRVRETNRTGERRRNGLALVLWAALLTALPATPSLAQGNFDQPFFDCSPTVCSGGPNPRAYQYLYSAFPTLGSTAQIVENLRIVENLYMSPSFGEVTGQQSASYYRNLAAINSQLQTGSAIPGTGNSDYSYIPVFNIWNMAGAIVAQTDPNNADVAAKFNLGDLVTPGNNAAPDIYYELVNTALDAAGATIDSTSSQPGAKDFYAAINVYGTTYVPPLGASATYPAGDPRPFQTSPLISTMGWNTLPADQQPAFYAVSIQQSSSPSFGDGGVHGTLQAQDWSGYTTSPAFPSGHSTEGAAIGIISAMAAPRYYKELMMAGAAFGRSRNIFGVHYPLDVIGGRMAALYGVSYLIDEVPSPSSGSYLDYLETSVIPAMGRYLSGSSDSGFANRSPYAQACESMGVGGCIRAGLIPTAQELRNLRQQYVNLATYSDIPNGNGGFGFTPNPATAGREMGTTQAERSTLLVTAPLLATRFPYLDAAQWAEILRTTALPSGGPLDNESGWDRINLFAGADGYGRFDSNVTVSMDASKGGFHAFDVWGNDIDGAGGLAKQGSGTLVLAGDSTYSGGTLVQQGTLALSGSLMGAVDVRPGATFYNGGLVTALKASRVYNAGTLTNDGTIISFVYNDGFLDGNGLIRGDLVNAGTVSPGNSLGTITVDGTVTFLPGSTYAAEFTPDGRSDLLSVTGTTTIENGSTLQLAPLSAPQRYDFSTMTVLSSSGGINGRFSAVTDPFGKRYPFIDANAVYGSDTLRIEIGRSDVPFTAYAHTKNERAAAAGLDTVPVTAPIVETVAGLRSTFFPGVFNQLSGEIYASNDTIMREDSRFVRQAALTRALSVLDHAGAPGMNTRAYDDGHRHGGGALPTPAGWGVGYGSWGSWDATPNLGGLDRDIGGFAVGIDQSVAGGLRLGLLAGYAQANADLASRRSSSTIDTTSLGIYGAKQYGQWKFAGGGAIGWHDIDTDRAVAFADFSDRLSADYDALGLQAFGEARYRLPVARTIKVEPFANVALVHLDTDGFSEKGGSAALTSPGWNSDSTFVSLGVHTSTDLAIADGTAVSLSLDAAWRHAFGDLNALATLGFAGGGSPFQVFGQPIAKDALALDVGAEVALGPMSSVVLSYSSQISEHMIDQGLSGNVKLRF